MGFRIAVLLMAGALASCSEPDRRYSAEGIVRGVDAQTGQVLIEHDKIEGLMGAMTMSFDADAEQLEGLAQGQVIDFVIVTDGRSYRVDQIAVKGNTFTGQKSGFEGLAKVGELAAGFELIDQNGEIVSLASLRGASVVLDFIYASCPGPCPILTSAHVDLQRRLPSDLRARTRFVSISIDPERDTPQALRSYAEARGADLSDWSFLTGDPDSVGAVLSSYGVGSVRTEEGEIDHVVATFLIAPDGRIAYRYLGLEHDVNELAADLGQLALR